MSFVKKLFPEALKNNLKRFVYDVPYQSHYSQAGEDVLLVSLFWSLLEKGYKGTYVDVGAYHPVSKSNTYYFYLKGWSGINVEPNPKNIDDFKRLRPLDVTLNLAVSNATDQHLYYCFSSKSGLMNYVTFTKPEKGDYKEIEHKKLEDIIAQHLGDKKIDFMSIDTEGFDIEVLKSNNWQKYRPSIILTEVTGVELADVFETPEYIFLKEQGYNAIGKLPVTHSISTLIFADKDFRP